MSEMPVEENLPKRTVERGRKLIVVGKSRIPKPAQLRMEASREKQLRALELRKARATYQQIADALGYASPAGAREAVMSALKRQEFEAAKDVVLLDLQTLDELQMRCTEALRKGDLFQVDRILRVMQQRYSLLGVNSRTVDELQEHMGVRPSTAIQNNGVMVVQGTSSEFVRSMMQAVGVDPDAPQYKEKLLELEAGEKKTKPSKKSTEPQTSTAKRKIVRRKKKNPGTTSEKPVTEAGPIEGVHISAPIQVPSTHNVDSAAQNTDSFISLNEDEIIDAEIVEDDVDV